MKSSVSHDYDCEMSYVDLFVVIMRYESQNCLIQSPLLQEFFFRRITRDGSSIQFNQIVILSVSEIYFRQCKIHIYRTLIHV